MIRLRGSFLPCPAKGGDSRSHYQSANRKEGEPEGLRGRRRGSRSFCVPDVQESRERGSGPISRGVTAVVILLLGERGAAVMTWLEPEMGRIKDLVHMHCVPNLHPMCSEKRGYTFLSGT